LRYGNYVFEVKSKKDGSFSWSQPLSISFSIKKEFYQMQGFIAMVVLFAIMLVSASIYFTFKIFKQRQSELERLVKERTIDLEKAIENLALRNKELDQFVYSASHDMSAPLKSLLGLINVAKLEISGRNADYLFQMMERSIKKLEKFIWDVTNYSRNTRLRVAFESVKPREIIMEILEDLSYSDNYNKIKFNINIPGEKEIMTDHTRLRIILNNLISNAIKFQRPQNDQGMVTINLKESDTEYSLEIEDNGTGIAAEYQKKIFDMFFRASTNSEGSGLGLYILNETVQKLNGRVQVQSEVGAGSVFMVHLPKMG
jgi:signal transduction histidine kinase